MQISNHKKPIQGKCNFVAVNLQLPLALARKTQLSCLFINRTLYWGRSASTILSSPATKSLLLVVSPGYVLLLHLPFNNSPLSPAIHHLLQLLLPASSSCLARKPASLFSPSNWLFVILPSQSGNQVKFLYSFHIQLKIVFH